MKTQFKITGTNQNVERLLDYVFDFQIGFNGTYKIETISNNQKKVFWKPDENSDILFTTLTEKDTQGQWTEIETIGEYLPNSKTDKTAETDETTEIQTTEIQNYIFFDRNNQSPISSFASFSVCNSFSFFKKING
jgi:hypothetical protein